MSSGKDRLGRVHRIRQLEEDQARIALQAPVAALRQVEAGIERALLAEAEARGRRNAAFLATGVDPESWKAPESEAQINRVLAVRDARALPRLEQDVRVKRESYLDRRRERQKLEGLLQRAEEKQELEKERKNRKEMDDLHQARRRHAELLRAVEER